ncbi:unnamed protein product [Rotaria sp. Silwood1]|nr:unnamed protein product [Rotaria sp. Silwood1]
MDFLSLSSTNETNELNSIINARRLYKSCVNQETIEADSVDFLLSLINNEFGGWPILQGPIWNNSTFNLSNLLLKMAEYNLNSIYVVMTTVDDKNSSMHAIGVGQGTLGLGERQLYESESALTNSYRQWIQDLALILTNVTSMIDNDVTSIFEFEKKIAEYSSTTAEQIAHQKDNIRTTVKNLSNIINSSIDFSNYIRRVYELVNVTLNDTDLVIVGEIEYLRNVSKLITQYSSRTVRNYFIWSFMMKIIDYMPKRYRATKQQFTQILEGAVAEVPRSLTCSSNVNSLMGFALSRLYVPKYFDEKARNEAYRKWAQENPNADKKLPGLNKYSREQLLFINYGQIWCAKIRDSFMSNFILADVHSPPQFRVIGSTSNFVEFDRAFGCKPGQLNSRVNKCILW